MAEEMILTIVLRREVPDRESGDEIYNLVVDRLSDHPEVTITGHVTNHFEMEE